MGQMEWVENVRLFLIAADNVIAAGQSSNHLSKMYESSSKWFENGI